MRQKEKYLKTKLFVIVCLLGVLYFVIQHNQQELIKGGFPESYDLRNVEGYSYVTPVKDQKVGYQWWNNIDASWAFAALASLESNLLKQQPHLRADEAKASFSAWYLANKNGYNQPQYEFNPQINPLSDPPNPLGYNVPEGETGWDGSVLYAIDYLSHSQGVVLESSAPWPKQSMSALATLTPPNDTVGSKVVLKKGVIYSPENYASLHHFHAAIKQAILSHGAVATYMYMGHGDWPSQEGKSFWRDENYREYYCDRGLLAGMGNHAVTVIGWNDTRKIGGAPGQGAWLVKNSFGTDWQDKGFFWISYYDRVFLSERTTAAQLIGGVGPASKGVRYQTHPGALSLLSGSAKERVWGYLGDGLNHQGRDSWGAARFQTTNDGRLTAVGVMTVNPDELLTIRVYSRWNKETNQPEDPLHAQKIRIKEPGYHLIDLDTAVPLWKGQEFVVAVGFDARNDVSNEPLVVVANAEFGFELQRTFRNTYTAEAEFGVWEDYALTGVDGGKTFYVQAVVE